MAQLLAIIGGTGLTALKALEITRREMVSTPYGEPSGPVTHGELCGREVIFLARHGYGHTIPPHKVNYRANLWALRHIGVDRVIAVAAVGGIRPDMEPGCLVFPDQIVDYTWSRCHTFFEADLSHVTHIDFTHPYSEDLRNILIKAARQAGLNARENGTYGATQGPRLETAAEIARMERDGCDLVGMTGMPEAALAREIGLSYATCAVVANWAAGKSKKNITMEEIQRNLVGGIDKVRILLRHIIPLVYNNPIP
jgi:5'-methylthioinosine phosphorylase